MKILKIDSTGKRFAGNVAESEIEAGVLSGVLTINFDYADLVYSSPVPVGLIPSGKTISEVEIKVIEAFDNSAQITVGHGLAHASLMLIDESELGVISRYIADPDFKTTEDTDFRIYSVGGTPTMGLAQIKIFYQ